MKKHPTAHMTFSEYSNWMAANRRRNMAEIDKRADKIPQERKELDELRHRREMEFYANQSKL